MWFNGLVCLLAIAITVVDSASFDRVLDTRQVQDSPDEEFSIPLLQECARKCHENITCMSFVHDDLEEKCQLFSELFLSQQGEITHVGRRMYRKVNVCEIPTVTDGDLQYIEGQKKGCRSRSSCDDYHFSYNPDVVCVSGGVSTGLASQCISLSLPYRVMTGGRLHVGWCIVAIVTPLTTSSATGIEIANNMDTLILLSASFRFSENAVVRNSLADGSWASEERSMPYFPVVKGQEANFTLCTETSLFRMFVDNVEIFTFNHRHPSALEETIEIKGAHPRSVTFKQ